MHQCRGWFGVVLEVVYSLAEAVVACEAFRSRPDPAELNIYRPVFPLSALGRPKSLATLCWVCLRTGPSECARRRSQKNRRLFKSGFILNSLYPF